MSSRSATFFHRHWGRTIAPGDNSLFTSVTMNFNPAYFKFGTTDFSQRAEKVLEYERPVLIRKHAARE